MKETEAVLLEKQKKETEADSGQIKDSRELIRISYEDKQLEKENVELKENVRMKDILLGEYKIESVDLQSKITEIKTTKESFQNLLKSKELDLEIKRE